MAKSENEKILKKNDRAPFAGVLIPEPQLMDMANDIFDCEIMRDEYEKMEIPKLEAPPKGHGDLWFGTGFVFGMATVLLINSLGGTR